MNWQIIVVIILIIDIFVPFVLNLIDVPQKNYLNYIVWINAILLFYIILPKSKGTIFE